MTQFPDDVEKSIQLLETALAEAKVHAFQSDELRFVSGVVGTLERHAGKDLGIGIVS